jgi:hypothetical protein
VLDGLLAKKPTEYFVDPTKTVHLDFSSMLLVKLVVFGYNDIGESQFFRFGNALFNPLNGPYFSAESHLC